MRGAPAFEEAVEVGPGVGKEGTPFRDHGGGIESRLAAGKSCC